MSVDAFNIGTSQIVVKSFRGAKAYVSQHGENVSGIISVGEYVGASWISDAMFPPFCRSIPRLRLTIGDDAHHLPGFIWQRRHPPQPKQVRDVFDFVSNLSAQRRGKRIIVHCRFGVCRSAGVALALYAYGAGDGYEGKAVESLMKVRPKAVPDLGIVAVADEVLQRDGRLLLSVLNNRQAGYNLSVHESEWRHRMTRTGRRGALPCAIFNSLDDYPTPTDSALQLIRIHFMNREAASAAPAF